MQLSIVHADFVFFKWLENHLQIFIELDLKSLIVNSSTIKQEVHFTTLNHQHLLICILDLANYSARVSAWSAGALCM